MYASHLQHIGLSSNAAQIYATLVEYGELSASRIARLSRVERSMTYVHLKELIEKELVQEDKQRGVARFSVTHPQHLEELVRAKRQEADEATASFTTVIHQLQQQFETRSGQPGVRFFDGETGLKYINNQLKAIDIDELLLIRPNISSKEVGEYNTLIRQQRDIRLKKQIPLNIITPSIDLIAPKLAQDKENLIERRIIAQEMFDTPAQILIYDNTVAITTYQEPTLTTIIEQPIIATTIKTLFMYIWRSSLAETRQWEGKMQQKTA